jgi:hypothetical protein
MQGLREDGTDMSVNEEGICKKLNIVIAKGPDGNTIPCDSFSNCEECMRDSI